MSRVERLYPRVEVFESENEPQKKETQPNGDGLASVVLNVDYLCLSTARYVCAKDGLLLRTHLSARSVLCTQVLCLKLHVILEAPRRRASRSVPPEPRRIVVPAPRRGHHADPG